MHQCIRLSDILEYTGLSKSQFVDNYPFMKIYSQLPSSFQDKAVNCDMLRGRTLYNQITLNPGGCSEDEGATPTTQLKRKYVKRTDKSGMSDAMNDSGVSETSPGKDSTPGDPTSAANKEKAEKEQVSVCKLDDKLRKLLKISTFTLPLPAHQHHHHHQLHHQHH